MRAINIEFKATIPFPVDSPDDNGCIYSKDTVIKALSNLKEFLPVLFINDSDSEYVTGRIPQKEFIIGHTTTSPKLQYSEDGKTIMVTINGVIYAGGTSCMVKEIKGKTVHDFDICAIGIAAH